MVPVVTHVILRARAVPNRSPAVAKMGSEEVLRGPDLAESGIAPQAGAPPLEGCDSASNRPRRTASRDRLAGGFYAWRGPEVPGGTEVFLLVNAMIEKFERVVMSQDWHLPRTLPSRRNTRVRRPMTSRRCCTASRPWPDHCVQGRAGHRVGFFQLIERVSRADTTPRDPSAHPSTFASPRPDVARRASFARATPALDPRSSLDRQDPIWMSTTPLPPPPFPARRPSLVSREFPPL